MIMSTWNIWGAFAVSNTGETIQKVSDDFAVSSTGVTYNKVGDYTVGSDGSSFTNMGDFSSDGSARIGDFATGLGAVFNSKDSDF
jgi:hypothetical protein